MPTVIVPFAGPSGKTRLDAPDPVRREISLAMLGDVLDAAVSVGPTVVVSADSAADGARGGARAPSRLRIRAAARALRCRPRSPGSRGRCSWSTRIFRCVEAADLERLAAAGRLRARRGARRDDERARASEPRRVRAAVRRRQRRALPGARGGARSRRRRPRDRRTSWTTSTRSTTSERLAARCGARTRACQLQADLRVKVVVLSGGVGGARFVRGVVDAIDPRDVTVIGNVGDDVDVLGLHVSPDLDSILYALAGLNDEERGWGRAGETWNALEQRARARRRELVRARRPRPRRSPRPHRGTCAPGEPLSAVTARLAASLGVETTLLPATDDELRTWIDTAAGSFPFQEWFVARGHRDEVDGVRFEGADDGGSARGCRSPRSRRPTCCSSRRATRSSRSSRSSRSRRSATRSRAGACRASPSAR